MNRRTALQTAAALAASSLAHRTARAEAKVERVVTKIAKNHAHELLVTPADVMAAVTKTYDLSGTSGHKHEVTITADDFKRLQAGGVFRTPSTRYEGAGHRHRVLVKIAPLVDPPESINVCEVAFGGQDDHELVVSAPDITAGVQKTFDVQGIAEHTHAVTLTAGDFAKLRTGAQVQVRTTESDAHTHIVFVRYPIKKQP